MTKEIGILDTQTLDVLLGLTEKGVTHQLLKPRHMCHAFIIWSVDSFPYVLMVSIANAESQALFV